MTTFKYRYKTKDLKKGLAGRTSKSESKSKSRAFKSKSKSSKNGLKSGLESKSGLEYYKSDLYPAMDISEDTNFWYLVLFIRRTYDQNNISFQFSVPSLFALRTGYNCPQAKSHGHFACRQL